MKVVIFGANGGTGQALLGHALKQKHDVVAAVRNPDKIAASVVKAGVRAVKADVLDRASVAAAIRGADAVLSAFGPADNKNPGTLMSEGVTNLVADLTGRVSLLFLPLPIVGADGAPARVLARPLDS